MKNTLKKLFITPFKTIPERIKSELLSHFPHALNIEWEKRKDVFEAIFYVDEVEHIAKISETNGLLEYKKNLRIDELPSNISEECRNAGEIMNAIANFIDSKLFYEIIVRDKEFNRTLLLLNQDGKLLKSNKI